MGAHWSLAVIFALVTWQLADAALPGAYGGGTRPVYWVAAVVATSLFLASLLAHESSHALVARHYGIGVRSITLWLFGGVAELEGEARTPGADFAIAAVGPGMSVALAGLFAGAQLVLERAGVGGLPLDVTSWLWQINLLLAAFNLVPAAPLDGGRILRAGLWKRSGDRTRAAVVAARAGRGFGVVLIGVGALEFFTGSPIGLWPAVLGWFLFVAAGAEESATRQRDAVAGLRVGAVMTPQPPLAPDAMTVAELLAGPIAWWYGRQTAVVVGPTGWIAGTVTVDRIRHVPEPARATTTLGAVAEPVERTPVGRPDEPMTALLARMYAAGGRPAVVLDAENRLAGIVTLDDVARAAGGPRGRAGADGPAAWGEAGRT